MPHKCTNCDRIYQDGSEDVLSGCRCGSRKFEYVQEQTKAHNQQREQPVEASNLPSERHSIEEPQDEAMIIASETGEDSAQKAARSEFIDEDDLLSATKGNEEEISEEQPPSQSTSESVTETNNDIDTVREELNSQFEGIRILEPGSYKINLMRLFEKQDCIISLQEDGRYVINVPEMAEEDVNV